MPCPSLLLAAISPRLTLVAMWLLSDIIVALAFLADLAAHGVARGRD